MGPIGRPARSATNYQPTPRNNLEEQGVKEVLGDTKKREPFKNPTKIEEIQEKKLLTEIEPLQLAF